MNDNYTKFEFEIQLLYTYYESNDNSIYTVSVGKINLCLKLVLKIKKDIYSRASYGPQNFVHEYNSPKGSVPQLTIHLS